MHGSVLYLYYLHCSRPRIECHPLRYHMTLIAAPIPWPYFTLDQTTSENVESGKDSRIFFEIQKQFIIDTCRLISPFPRSPPSHTPPQELQAAFRDPTSPYHIPEGSQGPPSPDEHLTTLSATEEGRTYFEDRGFDAASFWEQPIIWGDHDAFQYAVILVLLQNVSPSHLLIRHVNNVRYRAR